MDSAEFSDLKESLIQISLELRNISSHLQEEINNFLNVVSEIIQQKDLIIEQLRREIHLNSNNSMDNLN